MKNRYKKIVGIVTHAGNRDKAEAIQKTWLSKPLPPDHLALFVHGSDGGNVPRIESGKLFLPSVESWANLPGKIYDFFKYCSENLVFEYVYKIDDDVYLAPEDLVRYPERAVDYAGLFWDFRSAPPHKIARFRSFAQRLHDGEEYQGKVPAYYMNGPCYMVSKRFVDWFVSRPKECYEDCPLQSGLEDVMMGKAFYEFQHRAAANPPRIDDWRQGKNCVGGEGVSYSTNLSAQSIRRTHSTRHWRKLRHKISPAVSSILEFTGMRSR